MTSHSTTRRKQVLKRKNFFPTLLLTILLWLLLAALVYFVDPQTFGVVPLFFITVFVSLLFTMSLVFANSRRGLIISAALTLFLLFAYFGIGNILNLILLVAIASCMELYFSLR